MTERMIPKKNHSTKVICSLSMINKARSKINHMTNAIYFYDNKEDEKYHRQWKMDGHKWWSNYMGIFDSFVFMYLYFPNPSSSPYNAIKALWIKSCLLCQNEGLIFRNLDWTVGVHVYDTWKDFHIKIMILNGIRYATPFICVCT